MSFDLYFCWRKRERINFEEVKAWSEGIEYFKRNDAQLWYSNPKTGVYFNSRVRYVLLQFGAA